LLDQIDVQRDQRREIVSAVADDDDLRNELVRLKKVFDVLRGDILTAGGDDEVLLTVGDDQTAGVVESAEVGRMVPAVGQRLAGGDRVFEIAFKYVAAPDENFPVVGQPDLHTGNRNAHGAKAETLQPIDGRGRGGFGRPVAFQYHQAHVVEKLGNL